MSNSSEKSVKFITCGHVDDGKSTLLGRLLFEMDVLPEDQLAGATENGVLDYSRLTDGLEDEREQGITIDVAYRYVRHNGRNYRFADTPGHLQYLRNMAVAAPDGDVAILLIDAAHGVREQTLRHAKIAAFFGIKDFVLAINKMDKIDYDQNAYNTIKSTFEKEMMSFKGLNITAIPLSAIAGDNVIANSINTSWYSGPSLYDFISTFKPRDLNSSHPVLAVQNVVRITNELRGYQGTLRGGALKIGDKLVTDGTVQNMTVTDIYHSGNKVYAATAGSSITVSVDIDVDLSRGTTLSVENSPAQTSDFMEGGLVVLDDRFLENDELTGLLKIGHKEVSAQIEIQHRDGPIAYAEIYTASNITYTPFDIVPALGLFILIEKGTEKVIAVGKFFEPNVQKLSSYSI